MVSRGSHSTIAGTAVVTEFPMRMQDRSTTLGAVINKFRPTQYAVIVLLKNVRKITAARAEAIVIFEL